ncbi:MAG: hypothetical protein AAF170_17085 [Bacteroidota bacterium]
MTRLFSALLAAIALVTLPLSADAQTSPLQTSIDAAAGGYASARYSPG